MSRRSKRSAHIGLLLCGLAPVGLQAQVVPPPPPGTPSARVAPGAAYTGGQLKSALLGRGYRALWTTPIEVPVADLSAIGGGLTVRRVGGGMTTRTLHLDGADGRRYVFRSVDKTPFELLEDFAGSPLESILQDQISAFHPTGAPVVARLLEAVGVLHPEPTYMVVPDDPRLGEHREAFAGLLVLVEERPDDGAGGAPGFAGSRRIIQTGELFDELEEGPRHRVDAEDLLRARLVDLLIGDRDRSHNNHLWARFDRDDGGFTWRVIPRDRDQAFVRFDGFLKALARRYDRRLVSFGAAYPDVAGLTRNAWDIDRSLLVGLERQAWDRVVADVVAALTDEVVADAVSRMPPEHAAIIGEELRSMLLARRDHLSEAAETLYRIVFGVADVHATDEPERVLIEQTAAGTKLTVIPSSTGEPSFERTFSARETRELRVYMRGGDDRLTITGRGGVETLRVVGGGGEDRAVHQAPDPGRPGRFYDPQSDSEVVGLEWTRVAAPRSFSWFEDDRDLDWGSVTVPEPRVGYDLDRGLVLTAGLRQERYGFLKRPYQDRIDLRAGWAFGVNKPHFDYRHLRRQVAGEADIRLRFRWSAIEILNFYGFGNETETLHPANFHKVAHEQVTLSVAASLGDGRRRYVEVGPVFTYTSADTTGSATFLAETDPYGSGRFARLGVQASFEADGRDHVGTPSSGIRWEGAAAYYPGLLDADEGGFGTAHAQVSAYLSPEGGNPVLAVRAAGKRAWGPYPFTDAAFLGGPESVRGLREQRYGGDAMLLGSAELRVHLGRMTFPLPLEVGVLLLGDTGRVFYAGESSSEWHSSAGGGLWFGLINRSNLVHVAVARGETATRFVAGIGFAY